MGAHSNPEATGALIPSSGALILRTGPRNAGTPSNHASSSRRARPTSLSTSPTHKRRRPGDPPKMDQSQLLEAHQIDDVEYIRGVGRIVHARPRLPSPPPLTPPPSRTDSLSFFLNQEKHYVGGTIKWQQANKQIVFISTDDESVTYDTTDIKRLDSVLDSARFFFSSDRDGAQPLFMFGLADTEVNYVMRFRSTMANCVSLDRQCKDPDMDKKQSELRQCLERKAAEDNSRPDTRGSASAVSRAPERRGIARPVKRDRRSKSKKKSAPPAEARKEPAALNFGRESPLGSASVELSPIRRRRETSERRSTSPMADVPMKAGEHVFRVRRRCKLDDFQSRFDDGDIYDGPFVVTEVDDNQRAFGRRNGHSSGLGSTRQTKVRLNFHPEAQANPWVPLRRVRRALKVPRECTASMTNEEKWDAAVAASRAGRSGRASAGIQFVCKIDEENFVVGKVVAPDSLGDLQYRVDRLRRKRIVIGRRINFANEPTHDEDVQAYLSTHGPLKPGEVAVVEYRVHWAGWPSEDDSWERGHGNISPHFIEAFRAHHTQETMLPTIRS